MKDSYCVNIHSVNTLYFSIGEVDRYIEDKNGNKYLNVTSTDKNKEELTKYIGLQNKIKSLIEKIDDKSGEYKKDFIKIKFDSDEEVLLNECLHEVQIQFLYDLIQ